MLQKSPRMKAVLEWKSDVDLDLFCFYVTDKNNTGVVCHRSLGLESNYPYVVLDGDSKVSGQETVTVHNSKALKYLLFAAYRAIESGVGSFASARAQVVVSSDSGQTIEVPLLEKNRFSYWVAIALVDFTDPAGTKIQHVEKYSKRMTEKSPVLYKNGKFKMNVGNEGRVK